MGIYDNATCPPLQNKKQEVKFSVLLSIYSKENAFFLEACLKSIFDEQTVKPNEIILIKDGSLTPELEMMILDLQKKNPFLKVYGYRKNKGLGYALNYGIRKCSNELVFRMDTDDISVPGRFEKQLKYLENNPEVTIVGSTINEFLHTPNDISQTRQVPLNPSDIESKKDKRNPFNHMTVLFKKSIIIKVGGYIDMPGYEDYYLWMRLLQKHKGANIDEPLVHARIGNNMIERRQGISFLKKEIKFQRRLLKDSLIDYSKFIRNILVRGFPRILPVFLLKFLYAKLLRK